ncbi:hypothetical protein BACT_0665 [Bifidobacterium actinocoloniiforme DSM 22766]|uniref:Uncharacterized protein n=1 Tax=Bifidobacterium actinocoloniiforme DSM 22766 TaxID=1437605 RepID=A0A086Z0B4_9BIFI|nr:hypothetical protein [Bifidobacterium actinocoloniiforme]AKV55215.1 hypothetical protein AB656_01945 [Bifidobacterium actinocoloniiforme DSM 22766]KFI39964.1 hypothetical protein BACT_0665 [Bifidobacterium actinocoloniiforme DSM 22766]
MTKFDEANHCPSVAGDPESISDPATAMRIIASDQSKLNARFAGRKQVIFLVWGLAWLVGYLVLAFSSMTHHGEPQGWAYVLFAIALLCGAVLFVAFHVRASRGWRGQSQLKGAAYAWSWLFAFAAGMSICGLIVVHFDLSDSMSWLLYNSVAAFIVGLQYMAGGLLGNFDLPMYLGGLFMLVLSVAMLLLTSTVGFFVMALLGGGSFLTLALVVRINSRRHSTSGVEGGRA